MPAGPRKTTKVLATPQGKTYAVLLITLFVAVLMFFLAIRPAFLSITDQNKLNDEKRTYLKQLTDKENALKQLAAQEARYSEEIALLEQFLPDGRNDELVIANISRMAEASGCSVETVSLGPSKLPTKPDIIHITNLLSVEGSIVTKCSLSSMQQLLGSIESFPIPIEVRSIGYSESKVQESLGGKDYDLNMNITYYFWNSP